ncbi:MAG: hypothetical protein ACRYF0_09800 [Janthinobacterium lividum]
MTPRFFGVLLLVIALVSSAFVASPGPGFRLADIREMVLLPPVGVVRTIGAGNQAAYSPAASADASDALRQALLRHEEKLRLVGSLALPDTAHQQALAQLTSQVAGALERSRKRPLALPVPWLNTLLAARHQRYCLLSYVAGYTRTAANYRGKLAKDLGVGVLSMGLVVPITAQHSTKVGVFIYDAQTQAIVYYKGSWPVEKDPLAGVVIDQTLTDLLAPDFQLTDRI